ncbi:MAG: TIGR00725 family protein [Actinomycetota bacterium]
MLNISDKFIKISVIGGSTVEKDSPVYNKAYEVGKEIAKNGVILICGGLTGVMEAACKGAKEENGLTVGILPSGDPNTANKYVDLKIPTGMGYARNVAVVLSGDAVIAIDGSAGTLTEIGYALTYSKPLIAIDSWDIKPFYSKDRPDIIKASSCREAVEIAIKKTATL